MLLLGAHAEAVEVGTLVLAEGVTVGGIHQRHAELVQVVRLPAAHGIEHLGAGDVVQLIEGVKSGSHDRGPLVFSCTHTMTEPLVLVPGLMCDETVWTHQSATLGAGRTVRIAAHGLSDTLGAMAQRILSEAAPRFALAGHSMGGRVALEVMARAPERVTRLALLDTGYEALAAGEPGEKEKAGRHRLLGIARRDGMLPMARDWARGMVHPQRLADASLMDSIHAMISRAGVEQFEAQIRALLARPDRTDLLAQLRLPTLVLCGREDAWSPLSRHEQMARLIPGSRLVAIPDCGHMSTMERPQAITDALAEWLES
jgi:pimeloyl-ACP methyl ester carboxylesterase